MAQITFVRRKDLFFSKFCGSVNNIEFQLMRGDTKVIALPPGSYELNLTASSWYRSQIDIHVDTDRKILIKQYLPEAFFVIGPLVCIPLIILCFFLVISPLVMSIGLFLYSIPIFYVAVKKKNKFFKIKYV
jgi:hypothetical protein